MPVNPPNPPRPGRWSELLNAIKKLLGWKS